MSRSADVVRELVRHLNGDQRAYWLLSRLLEDIDITLTPLVPPPPAQDNPQQRQAPELPPEPVYAQPKPRRKR
jgi:hypothetical protein